MVDLNIKDANATGAGCGCGCGHDEPQTKGAPDAVASATVGQYTVSGMTCAHCVKAVTEEVLAIPGVTEVTVDLESGVLKIISAGLVDFDRIVKAVAEAGDDYTVS